MEAIQGFIAGIGTGIFITLIPGMLNMQVVSTSLRIGRRGAYLFNLGLVLVIVAQTILAVVFADYLRSTAIIPVIQDWAISILVVFAIGFIIKGYLARKARQARKVSEYTGGPFWRGLMISGMNVLNIPFIFALASFQVAHGILPNDYLAKCLFVPGVATGAYGVFFSYARAADWIHRRADYFTRNIFFFVGGLLTFLAVVQGLSR